MGEADLPPGIDRARHQSLSGRGRHVWYRRAVLVLITALPVLGLLNVFGQHASPVTFQSPAASLVIDSPAHIRGGLIFTTEIVITPHQQLHDARLYLNNGWFQAMTINGIAPQPSNESAQGSWQVCDFGQLPAATAYRVWIDDDRRTQDVDVAVAVDIDQLRSLTDRLQAAEPV